MVGRETGRRELSRQKVDGGNWDAQSEAAYRANDCAASQPESSLWALMPSAAFGGEPEHTGRWK